MAKGQGEDLSIADIKVALVTSGYTPDIGNHEFFSDITDEVVVSGYIAGGQSLTNISISIDSIRKPVVLSADEVQWMIALPEGRYAIIYVDKGTPATSPLLGYIDFGANKDSATEFRISWINTPIELRTY